MIDISLNIGIIESLCFHFQLVGVMRIYSMEAVGKHLRQKLVVEEEDSLTVRGSKPVEEGNPHSRLKNVKNMLMTLAPLKTISYFGSLPSKVQT